MLYWPITSSLDPTTLCYLQAHIWHFLFFLAEALNRRPLWATAPGVHSQWMKAGSDSSPYWLQLTRTLTQVSAFIISKHPRLLINYVTGFAYLHRCVLFIPQFLHSTYLYKCKIFQRRAYLLSFTQVVWYKAIIMAVMLVSLHSVKFSSLSLFRAVWYKVK